MQLERYCNFIFDNEKLPNEVIISTITALVKIDCSFKFENIAKHIQLSEKCIMSVDYMDTIYRSWNNSKKKEKRKKKKTKRNYFVNQITLVVYSDIENRPINIKLFNKTIHIVGATSMNSIKDSLNKLFTVMRKGKNIELYYLYTETPEKLYLSCLYNMKIIMINSDFNIGFTIDREALYNVLKKNNIASSYNPELCSAVVIHNVVNNNKITIMIYSTGAIMITGATNCHNINECYIFINKLLLNFFDKIYCIDSDTIMMKYINENFYVC